MRTKERPESKNHDLTDIYRKLHISQKGSIYKKSHAGKSNFDDMVPLMKDYFGLEVAGKGHLVLKDCEINQLKAAFVHGMAGLTTNEGTAESLVYGGYPLTIN